MTLFNGSFEKVALAAVPRSKYRSNSAGRGQPGLLELSERGHAAQTRRKAAGEGGAVVQSWRGHAGGQHRVDGVLAGTRAWGSGGIRGLSDTLVEKSGEARCMGLGF